MTNSEIRESLNHYQRKIIIPVILLFIAHVASIAMIETYGATGIAMWIIKGPHTVWLFALMALYLYFVIIPITVLELLSRSHSVFAEGMLENITDFITTNKSVNWYPEYTPPVKYGEDERRIQLIGFTLRERFANMTSEEIEQELMEALPKARN